MTQAVKSSKSQKQAENIRRQLGISIAHLEQAKQFNGHYCFNLKVIENLKKLNSQIEKSFKYLANNS